MARSIARLARIVLLAIIALLLVPATAMAGGWAMTSFDQLPDSFEAGTTYDLEYTILQHGETPVDVGTSEVRVISSDGTVTAFKAFDTAEVGRYSVSITFPEAGSWRWEVTQGFFAAHEMGTIDVAAAPVVAEASSSILRWLLPVALVIVIAMAALQGSALLKARRVGTRLVGPRVSAD